MRPAPQSLLALCGVAVLLAACEIGAGHRALADDAGERKRGAPDGPAGLSAGAVQGAAVARCARPMRWSRRSAGASPRRPNGRPTICGARRAFAGNSRPSTRTSRTPSACPAARSWSIPASCRSPRTEAGLAVVIGHEVAHALARHGAERMSDQMVAQVGATAAAVALVGDLERAQPRPMCRR